MFLIFVNDVTDAVANVPRQLYADDLKLFSRVDNCQGRESLQVALDNLSKWTQDNQLDLAANKCKVMHIGANNENTNYYLDACNLEAVTQMRDLGIIITNDLRFRVHCENTARKASIRACSIYRGFASRNTDFLMRMFDTFVLPLVEYASVVWNPSGQAEINVIERIQRRFTKRLPGMAQLGYEERLTILQRPTLQILEGGLI